MYNRLIWASGAAICLIAFLLPAASSTQIQAQPQDQSPRRRHAAGAPPFPHVFLRDVVVSNRDHTLKDTDILLNSEPGIAVDPLNPRKIVISAFSGAWSKQAGGSGFQNAPVWYSQDGGALWTKEFTIPAPPGVAAGLVSHSPCDETFDYGRNGVLYGTFLLDGTGEEGASCSELSASPGSVEQPAGGVFTGATTDPGNAGAWRWLVIDGKTQPTNRVSADQPWIVVSKDPSGSPGEKVYVGYQAELAMRVAAAEREVPPDFTVDESLGPRTGGGFNPGLRIAANRRSGAIYSLYEQSAPISCPGSANPISYVLNRSLDGGATWRLDGNPDGIAVAQVCSHQDLISYSFGEPEPSALIGGVNPLRGGVDAITVDSKSGGVYVVYGDFDAAANRDRLSIVRVTDSGRDGIKIWPSHFVSGTEHQSALPAVAVVDNGGAGAVGVLYDTADGLGSDGRSPYFSVHFAVSRDHGKSFHDVILQKFLFPEDAPRGPVGPRPLGDYQQLKSHGTTFYGVFSGDGEPFGRPFQKIDPIFMKTSAR